MESNPFSEQYKKLSNAELVDIIDNSSDYQPIALEAAQLELDNRKLSGEQLIEAKTINETEPDEPVERRIKKIDKTVSAFITSIIDSFKPIHSEDRSKDLLINILCIGYGLVSLYFICVGINYLMGSRSSSDSGLAEGFWFSPFTIILPIAVVLFWLRTKAGWILFCIYWSYQFFLIFWLMMSSPRKIDISEVIEFVIGFFTSFIFWPSFRKLYNVSLKTALIVVGTFLIITMILWILVL